MVKTRRTGTDRWAVRSPRLAAVLAALLLISATVPAPAEAYKFTGGVFNNSSIGDGVLGVCFENNSPVYTHRGILMSGLRKWADAKNITLNSNGRCDNDGSNLEVHWDSQIPCAEGAAYVLRRTGTYTFMSMFFNSACGAGFFWWGGTVPVPDTQYDAYSIAMHEMGHVYGLDHENSLPNEQLMESTVNCINNHGRVTSLSADDAAGIRALYPAIGNTGNSFGPGIGCHP